MRLRFTIGPVQELVRKSRRTRDLWASSFLLSYVSGCAMAGAREHGTLVVPDASGDALLRRIEGDTSGEPPRIGSLPNRFDLETAAPEAAARAAKDALDKAWERIWRAVWSEYVEPVASLGAGTKGIFDRQVSSLWEIQWVAAPEDTQLVGLLERRKAWRSRVPPVEHGDKCVVMPELQELSGFVRARGEAEGQKKFWASLKDKAGLSHAEIRENERLSGVALVKRLYPRKEVVHAALGWDPEASRWRSTVYVAAVPWIQEAMAAQPSACDAYARAVLELDRDAKRESGASLFERLDGNYLFADAIENPDLTLPKVPEGDAGRRALREKLRELYGSGEDPIGPPASSYALLLMDGDRVGKLLGVLGGEVVSAALRRFTEQVPHIVEAHQGSTIYAGGDDVLAMLPVPGALECARELRAEYRKSFEGAGAPTSAAVVFAQIRVPLRQVLEEAHHLLDDVAKDGNGRDSIAVSVLRRGGRTVQWVSTWDDADSPGQGTRLDPLLALTDRWRGKAKRRRSGDEAPLTAGEMSVGLVYRLRELFSMLCGWARWEPGLTGAHAEVDLVALVAAEIRRARRAAGLEDDDGTSDGASRDARHQEEAREMAGLLVQASRPATRDEDGHVVVSEKLIGLDAALLALFLANDGKERDHGAMGGA